MAILETQLDINHRIRHEHEHLRDVLGVVNRILAAHRSSAEDVVDQLSALREELEMHFHTEEAEGFFEELTEMAPRLMRHTTKLCQDHVRMLNEMGELVFQASHGDGSADWWSLMEQTFRDFSKALMQHEHRENELLQEAFGDDLGSHD